MRRFETYAIDNFLGFGSFEKFSVTTAHKRGEGVDHRIHDQFALHCGLDVRDGLPGRVEFRKVGERRHGVAQRAIGRLVSLAGSHDIVEGLQRLLVRNGRVCHRAFEVSTPRISHDPKRYGSDTGMDGMEVILVPRAVVIDGDDKVGSPIGIAEDVRDQSLVDTHAIMEEDDGGSGAQPWDQGLDRIDCRVCLDRYDERLDRKEGVLDVRVFRLRVCAIGVCIFGPEGVTDETSCLFVLVQVLFRCFEDLGAEGRRFVHHTLPFDLEDVSRQVRFPQLGRGFVYEYDAMFSGVEGLGEMVRDEGTDWAYAEDMEVHWLARTNRAVGTRPWSRWHLHSREKGKAKTELVDPHPVDQSTVQRAEAVQPYKTTHRQPVN